MEEDVHWSKETQTRKWVYGRQPEFLLISPFSGQGCGAKSARIGAGVVGPNCRKNTVDMKHAPSVVDPLGEQSMWFVYSKPLHMSLFCSLISA